MRFSFPYKKDKDVSGYIFRPKIPVLLSHNGRSLDVIGILDSGSDTLSMPKFIADDLKIKLSPKKKEIMGIGGSVHVRYGLVNITIESKSGKYLIRSAKAAVPMKADDQIDDIIIGRIPFFEHFKITFDENAKRVTMVRTKRK